MLLDNSIAFEFSVYWFLSGLIMLVPHLVLTFFIEKRKYFALRTVIGILLFALAAYLVCYSDQWNERYYLLLHLAGALYLVFCSKCSLKMAVFFNVLCIVLYYFIYQVLGLVNAVTGVNDDLTLVYLYKGISLICLIVLEAVIIRIFLVKDVYSLPASQVVIAVLISVAIITFNTITFANTPKVGYTRYIFQVFSMMCNLLAIYIQVVSFYSQKEKYENEYIKKMWHLSKKDNELRADYIDLLNRKHHDLKHEIKALRQLGTDEQKGYLDSIENSVDQFSNLYQTDNEMLDALLNEARRHCDREKIKFLCIANCKNTGFVDAVDLSILIGNLIDNAIEAVSCLPVENRVIDLKMMTDEHFFRIIEKNTFKGTLEITKNGIVSSKPDNGYHGFGTHSMKYIVDKYTGQMAIDAADGIFSLYIVIPVVNKTS